MVATACVWSGVLTTTLFLYRFPTVRSRVNEFYEAFLCKHFSPPADVEIRRQGAEWGKQNNVSVKIEQQPEQTFTVPLLFSVEEPQRLRVAFLTWYFELGPGRGLDYGVEVALALSEF